MPDAHVVADAELADAQHDIQMADLHIVFDHALRGCDNAESNPHAFADSIPKEQPVAWPHQK